MKPGHEPYAQPQRSGSNGLFIILILAAVVGGGFLVVLALGLAAVFFVADARYEVEVAEQNARVVMAEAEAPKTLAAEFSSSAEVLSELELRVSATGEVTVDGTSTTTDELADFLQNQSRTRAVNRVNISADSSVRYEVINEVASICNDAGFEVVVQSGGEAVDVDSDQSAFDSASSESESAN